MLKLLLKLLLNAFAWCNLWVIYWISSIVFLVQVKRASHRDGKITILSGWLPQYRDEFPQQIRLALRLIDEHDPRRAQTVRNNIRVIFDNPLITSHGQYDHDRDLCLINYDALRSCFVGPYPLDERIQAVLTAELASLLIHEATHGRMFRWRIPYNEETWERCERICRAEEARFRRHVSKLKVDLRGRPIDWDKWYSLDAVKDDYLASRAMSHWDRMSHRFRAAYEVVNRIQDDESDNQYSVRDSTAPAKVVSRWSESTRTYAFHRNQPAISPAILETTAYAFARSGLPYAAAECYAQIEAHGWQMPWLDRYMYGKVLYTLHRFEEAIEVFRTIESEDDDTADTARLQIGYCLQCLDRFDEADQILGSIKLESIVSTQSWFYLGTALKQQDAAQAFEILDQVFGDTVPENVTDENFFAHALRPYLAWLMGRQSEASSGIAAVLESRQRWLSENAETIVPRRAIIVHADESLYELGPSTTDASVIIRTDQDVSDEQLAAARRFAKEILNAARGPTSNESEETLQGLLYGNLDFLSRDVDWEAIDPGLRLEGTWFVADLPIDRLFLEKGKLQGDLLDVWVDLQDDQPRCILRGQLDLSTPIEDTPKKPECIAPAPTSGLTDPPLTQENQQA